MIVPTRSAVDAIGSSGTLENLSAMCASAKTPDNDGDGLAPGISGMIERASLDKLVDTLRALGDQAYGNWQLLIVADDAADFCKSVEIHLLRRHQRERFKMRYHFRYQISDVSHFELQSLI